MSKRLGVNKQAKGVLLLSVSGEIRLQAVLKTKSASESVTSLFSLGIVVRILVWNMQVKACFRAKTREHKSCG